MEDRILAEVSIDDFEDGQFDGPSDVPTGFAYYDRSSGAIWTGKDTPFFKHGERVKLSFHNTSNAYPVRLKPWKGFTRQTLEKVNGATQADIDLWMEHGRLIHKDDLVYVHIFE